MCRSANKDGTGLKDIVKSARGPAERRRRVGVLILAEKDRPGSGTADDDIAVAAFERLPRRFVDHDREVSPGRRPQMSRPGGQSAALNLFDIIFRETVRPVLKKTFADEAGEAPGHSAERKTSFMWHPISELRRGQRSALRGRSRGTAGEECPDRCAGTVGRSFGPCLPLIGIRSQPGPATILTAGAEPGERRVLMLAFS